MESDASSSTMPSSAIPFQPLIATESKRSRYNPSAPINISAHELAQMSSANPLGRKKLREEAKRKKRAEEKALVAEGAEMHLDT